MKRNLTFAVFFCTLSMAYGQVRSYVVDASKVYDNNTRIAYLTIDADLDKDLISVIELELLQHPDVVKFAFDKSDLRRCMFESKSDVTEDALVGMINDVIENYTPVIPIESSFAKFEDLGSNKNVYFQVVGFTDVRDEKEFILDLEHSKYVISVERFDDGLYKVKAEQGLTADQVSILLAKYGASLDEKFIKN